MTYKKAAAYKTAYWTWMEQFVSVRFDSFQQEDPRPTPKAYFRVTMIDGTEVRRSVPETELTDFVL